MYLIIHCRKSILSHNSHAWFKKSSNVPSMSNKCRGFGAAMGLFILNKVNRIVHVECHGLYRDDGLIIVYGNQRANDNIRKILFKPFQGLDFEIQLGYMAEQSHLYCP